MGKVTDSTLYIHYAQNKLICMGILLGKDTDSTIYNYYAQNKLIYMGILLGKVTDSRVYIHFPINFASVQCSTYLDEDVVGSRS